MINHRRLLKTKKSLHHQTTAKRARETEETRALLKTVDDRNETTPRTDMKLSRLVSGAVSPSAKRPGGYESVKHIGKKSDPKDLASRVGAGLLKGMHSHNLSITNSQKLKQKLALINRSHLPAKGLLNASGSQGTRNSSL